MANLEEKLKDIANKYREDPDTYMQEYISLLDTLSSEYETQNKFLNSIMLRERAIKVVESYYAKNKSQYSNHFIHNLNKLSNLYKRCSHIEEARSLEQKAKKILQVNSSSN